MIYLFEYKNKKRPKTHKMPTQATYTSKYSHPDFSEEPKKSQSNTPAIYIYLQDIHESIKIILGDLFEGLAHLDVKVIFDEEEPLETALEKANMILILNQDKKLLKKAWENGVVTITNKFTNEIADYNPNNETGNSFIFENFNEWEIFAAVVRALETYKFPYDWKFISRSCKKSV